MITLVCPTRGRPEQFHRMVMSAVGNASSAFRIFAYLDDDDPKAPEYQQHEFVQYFHGPRKKLIASYEHLISFIDDPIVGLCSDDIVFYTSGWDKVIKGCARDDGIFFIGTDDGTMGKKEPGAVFIGRRMVELLDGRVAPEGMLHSCADNFFEDIAKRLGRAQRVKVVTEHMHPKYNKAPQDETYQGNSEAQKLSDGVIWRASESQRINLAHRLSAYLK